MSAGLSAHHFYSYVVIVIKIITKVIYKFPEYVATMLCYAMLCYAMLCYAMLCYAMLCYAMLCYAMAPWVRLG